MTAIYDTIGIDYANLRKPDPRIAAQIHRALGSAQTVLNVGAGTGSYEPTDRCVTAVEPSAEMLRQRPTSSAPAVQASAEDLPFADDSFDAVMAVLTVHHWTDKLKGMSELRRVARGPIVLLTYDPAHRGNWLADYLPELIALDDRVMPTITEYARWLGPVDVNSVLVPHDCSDGFLYAYWRRPRAYLDPRVRAGMSGFWLIPECEANLERLRTDLDSGAWLQRYGDLLVRETCDLGYRLIVAA